MSVKATEYESCCLPDVYVVVNLSICFSRCAHLALETPADNGLYCTVWASLVGSLYAREHVTHLYVTFPVACKLLTRLEHTVQYRPLSARVLMQGEHNMKVRAADHALLMLSPFQSVVYQLLTVDLL